MTGRRRATRTDIPKRSKEVAEVISSRVRIAVEVVAFALLALCALPTTGLGAPTPAPAWKVTVRSEPTNLRPGASSGNPDRARYFILATNVGLAPSSGTTTLVDSLPSGITPVGVAGTGAWASCTVGAPTAQDVTCTRSEPLQPGLNLQVNVKVNVDSGLPEGETLVNQVSVSGGGAFTVAHAATTTTISSAQAPAGFLDGRNGLGASVTDAAGGAVTQAGSHPDQLTVDLGFPVWRGSSNIQFQVTTADGGVRDVRTYLPRGMIVNPSATRVRCTEAELEESQCPNESQVGIATVSINTIGFQGGNDESPLYNMVAPPGHAAAFAFQPVGQAIYVHLLGGLRDGDYALAADGEDILQVFGFQLFGFNVQLWGDSSDSAHDFARGEDCLDSSGCSTPVSVPPQGTPLLTMPTSCGDALDIEAAADTWNHPGDFQADSAPFTDLLGNQTATDGCSQLRFDPTLEARPTTTQADAPSGLSADLHVPQTDGLEELATAHLRKAVVRLPEGMSLNPSSANGLQGCSSAQIGIDPATGVADGNRPSCPDASRIGGVEVDSPLIDNALPGSVYVATPYDNPFDSLLAIYVVVDDPISGTLIKLSGHVEPDPNTGRLTTTFDNNPQLPFTDFKLDFFGGPGGVLRTPAVCGSYSTTSSLTPWSTPESGPPAAPSDSWSISGNCSQSESAQPNKPEFEAGAESPIAGKYTPFVVHLKREDGSQQFSKLRLTPPPGLTAKLAGTPACSDGALAAAEGKSGRDEQANPSCPGDSKIGTVHVGAGAGPAPYYASGAAYLAGPYKGAPLSMAIITPAVAGPYDLGTVVTRVALHVDPTTTQITADADPVPSILKGIPLDVRSIDVALDKPDFSRTGTSCDPFAVNGQLISTLGQGAELESPYQLGNCANLAFKPLLGLRLKGATKRAKNPKLIATLAAKDGEANIASTAVTLPRSAFLDQSHIRTVCTRVQFAAGAGNGAECPAGSIYGQAWARSPLLDYTLTGNAYLRSSNHKLPDLVLAFNGPAYQPIAIELSGRTDSVKGALRNTFEAVPDAPVSFFRLVLFGGKRGLVQNSRDTCAHTYRANVVFGAQNGDSLTRHPKVKAQCRKTHHKKHKRHHRRGGGHGKR